MEYLDFGLSGAPTRGSKLWISNMYSNFLKAVRRGEVQDSAQASHRTDMTKILQWQGLTSQED